VNERRAKNAADWERESTLVIYQPMGLLAEQTLGIVGYGAIGKAVAQRAKAFGMTVQVLRNGKGSAQLNEDGASYAKDLSQLLASSDHVVLALPLTAASRGLINADALAYCKPGLHLINVARGGLVDQDALKVALRAHVAKEIGALAKPDDIRFTDTLPNTRPGKIMRRLLREIAGGGKIAGDVTTLEDFSVLEKLREDEE